MNFIDPKLIERAKMILAMEFIAKKLNNEDILERWLMSGIADGDIKENTFDIEEVDPYYLDDKNFKYTMNVFLSCMKQGYEDDSGLYCSGITSS